MMERWNCMTDEEKREILRLGECRRKLEENPLHPAYHFTAPDGALNDPNGLCFWQGKWHMFYQNNRGQGWCWGHAVSDDLCRWRDLPLALTPEKEQECWSGMVMIEEDRAIATYYGLNYGIMIAVSTDPDLLRWEKLNGGEPVIPKVRPEEKATRPYSVYDSCIWRKDDRYCIVSGTYRVNPHSGTRERQEFLFESTDLIHWEYKGVFLENDLFAVPDDDGACPYFVPCGNRYLFVHFSHHSGPKILVGDYDRERDKFVISNGVSLTSSSSFFGGLLAPSAYPAGDGSVRLIHNIHHNAVPGTDYQCMSLPRRVTLTGEQENDPAIAPAPELDSLRVGSPVTLENITLKADRPFSPEGISGDTLELDAVFEAKNVPAIEWKLLMSEDGEHYTAIRVYRQRGNTFLNAFRPGFRYRDAHETVIQMDMTHSSKDALVRIPDTQCFWLAPEEELRMRIYIDRSVAEVFVNGRVALSARISPDAGDNKKISLTSAGDDLVLRRLEVYPMGNAFSTDET